MQDKNAYSIFRPVDLHPIDAINDEAASPFPEDEHGDPVSQLRAYRLNSHPLALLAKARTAAEIAALAQHFAPLNARSLAPNTQAIRKANLASYHSMFAR